MSAEENTGNHAAFARPGDGSYGAPSSKGLTKIEYAAIQIMAGLAANSIPGMHHHADRMAADAVMKARALFEELSK